MASNGYSKWIKTYEWINNNKISHELIMNRKTYN